MRNIKFRAWDKRTNSMVDPSGHFIEFDGSVWFNDPWHGNTDSLHDQHDNLTLMQFTGLKDKNGVDIYEGDILSQNKCIVIWNQYWGWKAEYKDKFGNHSPALWLVVNKSEVIGNIHENPELLD